MRVSVLTSVSEDLPTGTYVWIALDVVRATTTMVTFLAQGGISVYATDSIEEALMLKEQDPELVLIGERNGLKIPGFDLDNSPLEVIENPSLVKNRRAVMTTTNGTRMISKLESGSSTIFIGSLVNLSAVIHKAYEQAVEQGVDGLAIACAGKEGRLVADDLYCAGVMVARLLEMPADWELDDAAKVANVAAAQWADPLVVLMESQSGRNILRYGKLKDVHFCARMDVFNLAPLVIDSRITL